jgi:hypothetical protein
MMISEHPLSERSRVMVTKAPSPDPSLNRTDLLAWGTVRTGLGLTFFGTLLTALCVGVLVVVALTNQPDVRKVPVLMLVIGTLSLLGVLAGLVLALGGACLTSAAPSGSGARGWGMAATVFAVASLVLGVVLGLVLLDAEARHNAEARNVLADSLKPPPDPPFSPEEQQMMKFGFQGTLGMAFLCYLLSLRRVASALKRRGLALGVVCYLLFCLACLAGVNVLVYGPRVPALENPELLVRVLLGGVALLFVWGLTTVALVRGSITRGIVHPE